MIRKEFVVVLTLSLPKDFFYRLVSMLKKQSLSSHLSNRGPFKRWRSAGTVKVTLSLLKYPITEDIIDLICPSCMTRASAHSVKWL